MSEVPEDVMKAAADACRVQGVPAMGSPFVPSVACFVAMTAIMAERERWKPAVTYFKRYCLDEADDVENCVCGEEQHEYAKAFEAVIRAGS